MDMIEIEAAKSTALEKFLNLNLGLFQKKKSKSLQSLFFLLSVVSWKDCAL